MPEAEKGVWCLQREGCVLCLGFFDGMHRGHQALLQVGRRAAQRLSLPLCAHTFDRSPSPFKKELTALEERVQLLKKYGADAVHVTAFDDTLRCMPGDAFFDQVILAEIGAVYVVCGHDHRFGHKGGWDAQALEKMCREKDIGFEMVEEFCLDGEKVSSTAIRRALQNEDMNKAEKLLGRPVPAHWKQVTE